MYRIAVIGAGQLGGRHLQGLVRIEPQSQYFVVDPSTEALQTAHTRVQETGVALAPDQVIYLTTLSDLPSHLDYVVVATAADVRLNVLKKLLAEKSVSNLLLEKVLFQHIKDYQAALDLFEMLPTKVWVNCPRRVFPIYQTVKNFFSGQQLLQFQASGGNWGLGCNSVHFLDLIGYLTDAEPSSISTYGLDSSVIPSKRANYYEFTGTIQGNWGGTAFEITSLRHSDMRLILTMRSQDRTCIVDEVGGTAFFHDRLLSAPWSQHTFHNPLVSEISTLIAQDILINSRCQLTSFANSVDYHLPLIQALGQHAAGPLGTSPDFCPIT